MTFSVSIVWPSVLSLNNLKILKSKAVNNICIQEKCIIRLIFNLGLASTRYQATRFRVTSGPSRLMKISCMQSKRRDTHPK